MRDIKFISASHYQTSERFYALPKILFESPLYENMRLDSKVAYSSRTIGLMKMEISIWYILTLI